jgi:MerR family transcriptional regulator, light-induced transcriptional regulator
MGKAPNRSEMLRLSEAARILEVGDTTLKRWTEDGRLPSERTLGGHRRFRRDEVMRLRSQLSGEKPTNGSEADSPDSRRWLDVPGDPTEPSAMMGRLMLLRSESRDWAETCDRLCSGLLAEIGERWSVGKMTCAQEHAMSRSLEVGLAKIGHHFPVSPTAATIVLACPPGERHTLGLTMVELVLRERGFRVSFLGGDVPARDVVETIRKVRPIAVGLGASACARPSGELSEPARAVGAACSEVGARLFLGGGAAWPPVRGATRVLTLMDLTAMVDGLAPRTASPAATEPALPKSSA